MALSEARERSSLMMERAGISHSVHHFGEPDALGSVDQREGGVDVRVQLPDHLQHQELVEIGVQQAADDRVQLPGVVVDAARNIGSRHAGRSSWMG
jgi:hypothetical protein